MNAARPPTVVSPTPETEADAALTASSSSPPHMGARWVLCALCCGSRSWPHVSLRHMRNASGRAACVVGGHLTGPWPALAVHGPICATISTPRCLSPRRSSRSQRGSPRTARLLGCSSDLTRGMEPQPCVQGRSQPLSAAIDEQVRLSRGCLLGPSPPPGNKTPLTEPTRTTNNLWLHALCGPSSLPWVSCTPIRPLSSAMRDDIFSCERRACLPALYGAMMGCRRP